MSISDKVYIVGGYEHPLRFAPETSVVQLHAEVALGALADAGLEKEEVDGYFCAGDAPGMGPISLVDYLNLRVSYINSTDLGGASYIAHIGYAAQAIRAGLCKVALITLAGRPRAEGMATGTAVRARPATLPEAPFEVPYRPVNAALYGMCAMRHMHEHGTTSEQLAMIKVAASTHAQHNPNALLPKVVSIDEVLASPMIADPLHRLDCCVITDGGGALVLAHESVARRLNRPLVRVRGAAATVKGQSAGQIDISCTGAASSGPLAFAQAGLAPSDIKYAGLYDSFTITVLMQLEDLGFCKKGQAGAFVAEGNLVSGYGSLPFNTDGGGLCNNHPGNRGGMTKALEALRQLRGEAHPAVQVPGCDLALVQGIGGMVATRHGAATAILEREQ